MQTYYVYILQSINDPQKYYTGFTQDIKKRLVSHNNGQSSYTKKYKPWKIKTCITFTDRSRALAFEKYLKTPSDRAFAKKRL